ncbi:MAG: MCE family protein [Nocardiopsaceae bacterium]|nr:MCE family protein [Nocardiopsaceae bacterium]
MRKLSSLSPRQRLLAGGVAVVALIAAVSAAVVLWPTSQSKHLTAYFTSATGLYTGDRVMVLGVPVGQVTSITPEPGKVKVEMSYAANLRIPADAKAAIITPTLVTTRTVQLTPVYTHGAVLPDGGTIPESRTAVPVEWDQIEHELNTLATALGPNGQSSGALDRLLHTSAANLKGQGTNLHNTLTALSQVTSVLADDRGNLFATVDNLQKFVQVLADANTQVDQFNKELESVSGVLAENKQELGTALSTLNSALGTVQDFVKNNRDALASNVKGLDSVTGNLAKSDQSLADVLQRLPNDLSDFNNIYDPVNHSISTELAGQEFEDPANFICSTIFAVGGSPDQCQTALDPLLSVLKQSSLPVSVDPLNRDGYSNQTSSTSGSSDSGSSSSSGSGSGTGGLANLLLGGK